MERIDQIMAHPAFLNSLKRLKAAEKKRKFCHHGMKHLLAVARIGYIDVLERGLPIPKDIMYAAGLLHDVGKYIQYEEGVPHHLGGPKLADQILEDCGYTQQERLEICTAIRNHSNQGGVDGDVAEGSLDDVLYRADKASRNCFRCKQRASCNWPEEKKNGGIIS